MNKKYIIICQKGLSQKVIPIYFDEHKDALVYKEALIKENPNKPVSFIIIDLDEYVDFGVYLDKTVEKIVKEKFSKTN